MRQEEECGAEEMEREDCSGSERKKGGEKMWNGRGGRGLM